jgi:hypothetical protein
MLCAEVGSRLERKCVSMTAKALAARQMGENLDGLMNLDPRGYGVCRILYPACRGLAGGSPVLNGAEGLLGHLKEGGLCCIMTGFVLPPHGCPETDGAVSAVLLGRMLAGFFGVTPVLLGPEDCQEPVKAMAAAAGLHFYGEVKTARQYPASMAFIAFPKERMAAEQTALRLFNEIGRPDTAVAVELPGANRIGIYHNAAGEDVTRLQAKTDLLFSRLSAEKVFTLAIGDLGNEAGLGKLYSHLQQFIPRAGRGECRCGCGYGLAAVSEADAVITATASDWGVCGLMAALGFLKGDMRWVPDGALYRRVLEAGCQAGLMDMGGWHIPAVDGFGLELLLPVIDLMRSSCESILGHLASGDCGRWFDEVLGKGFFSNQ